MVTRKLYVTMTSVGEFWIIRHWYQSGIFSFQVVIRKSHPGHLGNSCDSAGSGNEWFLTCPAISSASWGWQSISLAVVPRAARHPGPAWGCLGRGKRMFFHTNLNKRFEICSVFILIACLPWGQWPSPRIWGSCDNLDSGHKLPL